MKKHERRLLTEATAIYTALAGRQPTNRRDDEPPLDQWTCLMAITRQIGRAEELGWRLAAARLREIR